MLVIDYALDLDRARGQIGMLRAIRPESPAINLSLTIADPELQRSGFDRRHFLAFGAVWLAHPDRARGDRDVDDCAVA